MEDPLYSHLVDGSFNQLYFKI